MSRSRRFAVSGWSRALVALLMFVVCAPLSAQETTGGDAPPVAPAGEAAPEADKAAPKDGEAAPKPDEAAPKDDEAAPKAEDVGEPDKVKREPMSQPGSQPKMPNAADFRLEVTVQKVGADWKRSPAAQVPVLVEARAGDMVIKKHTGLTDASGVAVFKGLKQITGAKYIPVVAYQEVSYNGGVIEPKSDVARVSIDVFDKTYDDSNLQVSELMTTAQVSEGSVIFFQRWLFVNNAPQTFDPRGSMNPAYEDGLFIQMPKVARQTSAMLLTSSGRVEAKVVEDKVLFEEPIPPAGENQEPLTVQVQFAIPLKSSTLEVAQTMHYPTEGMRVIVSRSTKSSKVPELDLSLDAPGFEVGDNRDLPGLRQDMKFLVARGGYAKPGDTLRFTIDGLPARSRGWAWLMIALAGLVAVFGIGLWRYEASVLGESGRVLRRKALEQEREALYDQLAHLEDRYDAGELSDYRYDLEAAQLRERLALVLHRLEQEGVKG